MKKNPERLLNNILIIAIIRLLGFRVSRFLLYLTLTRFVFRKRFIKSLQATASQNFYRYSIGNTREENADKVHSYIRHYRMKLCEDIVVLSLNRRRLPRVLASNVVFEGIENYNQALDTGTGILAVGAHVGSVTWGTVALVDFCRGIDARRRRALSICTNPEIVRFFPPQDTRADYSFIPTDLNHSEMIRRIVAALKSNRIVTTNLDVMAGGSSTRVFLLFNKAKVFLPAVVAAAKLATLTNSVILPWTNRRDEHGGLVLTFEKPIGIREQGSGLPARLCRLLEKWILENPEQWIYWDRFQKRLVSDEAF